MEAYPSTNPTTSPSECKDDPHWFFDKDQKLGCKHIDSLALCDRFGATIYNKKTAFQACCICNGGNHISVSPSAQPTTSQKPSSTPSVSIEPTSKPSVLPSINPTVSNAPSDRPSGSIPTIYDGKACKYNIECLSGTCEIEEGESTGICKRGVSLFFMIYF